MHIVGRLGYQVRLATRVLNVGQATTVRMLFMEQRLRILVRLVLLAVVVVILIPVLNWVSKNTSSFQFAMILIALVGVLSIAEAIINRSPPRPGS